jgi:hypothetical protein
MLKNTNYVLAYDKNGFTKKSLSYDDIQKVWILSEREDKNSSKITRLTNVFKHKTENIFVVTVNYYNDKIFNINTNQHVTCLQDKCNGTSYGFKYNNKVYYLKDFLDMYENDHFIKSV